MIRYPYHDIAVDQLITVLLVEDSGIVLNALAFALKRILPRNCRHAAGRLREANIKFQLDMVRHLVEFFVAKGAIGIEMVEAAVWKEATSLTRVPQEPLRVILSKFGELWWDAAFHSRSQKEIDIGPFNGRLIIDGSRINVNISLCERLLRARPVSAID